MSHPVTIGKQGFFATLRKDKWWVEPALVAGILTAFGIYSTVSAVLLQTKFEVGPYLSPFYEPLLKPSWWPFSPAILILWAPLGFRATCYYYRGAYYKAFWADPPSCSVGEPRSTYWGERTFPLILQNIHRYTLYLALFFIVVLAWDAWKGFWFADEAAGGTRFGIGVGSLVLLVNVILLGGYTFSCHSLRHLVGGCLDCPSKAPLRYKAWECTSRLNARHMLFAWLSLFWVGFTDLYVRLCSMGVWTDFRLL